MGSRKHECINLIKLYPKNEFNVSWRVTVSRRFRIRCDPTLFNPSLLDLTRPCATQADLARPNSTKLNPNPPKCTPTWLNLNRPHLIRSDCETFSLCISYKVRNDADLLHKHIFINVEHVISNTSRMMNLEAKKKKLFFTESQFFFLRVTQEEVFIFEVSFYIKAHHTNLQSFHYFLGWLIFI